MSCQTIDNIFKCLEELSSSFSVSEENLIQTLKFELRHVRMHLKWHSSLYPPLLWNMRNWVEDVEKRLHEARIKVDMAVSFPEGKLSSLLLTMKVGKAILGKQCSLYYEDEQNGLNFPRRDIESDELILECIDPLLENLKHLTRCNDLNLLISPKKEIEALGKTLKSLRDILETTRRELKEEISNIMPMPTQDLLTRIKRIIENAVYTSCYSWAKGKQKRVAELFYYMRVKINHIEPEIKMVYVQLMKGSKISNPSTLGIHLQALAAVDSLLDNLQKRPKDKDTDLLTSSDVHQIEFLHQELSFVKYFLLDPNLKQYTETGTQSFNSLLIQLEDMARKGTSLVHLIISAGQTNDHMDCEMDLLHSSLLEVVELLKADIRQVYLRIAKPSISGFPHTPKLGILESFQQRLDELLKHRSDSISYVKNQIKVVQSELRFLSSFEIIKKLEGDEDVVKHVLNVACEAEHIIDLISASKLPNWYYMSWLSDVIEKIKTVKNECKKVSCNKSIPNVDIRARAKHPSQFYNLEEMLLDRFGEIQRITKELIGGSKELNIVSLVGVPGIGKTILADRVYYHYSIRSQFDIFAWYRVSEVYDMRDLLLSILSDVNEHHEEMSQLDCKDMAEALCKSLQGRRYLIVLQDIRNIDVWNDLHKSLPDDCNGSRILFTTRFHAIGPQANPRCIVYFVRPLSTYEAWTVLACKAFRNRRWPPELQEIGQKIARKCQGLPLSAVLIAGILQLDDSVDYWEKVLESLQRHQNIKGLGAVLEVIYKYLPDHLKACFLCLGAFAKDKEIPAWKLIRLMMAEGLAKKTMSESSEDVAKVYFMDLIALNLTSIARYKSNRGVKSCRVHDLVLEFSLKKAHDQNFFKISSEMNCGQYRHHFFCKHTIGWMPRDAYVRSLFLSPVERRPLTVLSNTFYNLRAFDLSVLPYILKVLRVLDLERVYLDSATFPTEIELLIHLRYLALQGRMNRVPSSIGSLWRIETFLLVGNEGEVTLPETLLKMPYLNLLYIRDEAAFEFSETFQPEKFLASDSIEKFSTLSLHLGDGITPKIIRSLRSLRKLKCKFYESLEGRNQFPILYFLSKLESLSMIYDGSMGVKRLSPHSFPSNLKKLTISNFRLPWSEISMIGRLPKLEVLKLHSMAFEGQRWIVRSQEFLKLKILELEGLDIKEWHASPYAFPCLEELVLKKCRQLVRVPPNFGKLPALKYTEAVWCSDSAVRSVRNLRKGWLPRRT